MKKNSYTIVDSYEEYKKENKGTPFHVNKRMYKDICYEFNKQISSSIIEDTLQFDMPARLGFIRVKKIKGKNELIKKQIDWQASKKYNKWIFHLNMHSDGYYYRWTWGKKNALFANKSIYSFKPTRFNKRKLAKLLKLNEIDFFE